MMRWAAYWVFVLAVLVLSYACNSNTSVTQAFSTAAGGNPSITGATPGVLQAGTAITITGSEFGTHSLDVEWLGGDRLDAVSAGTSIGAVGGVWPGWGRSLSSSPNPSVSTGRPYSGVKSLFMTVSGYSWTSGIEFDRGDGGRFQEVYATWWMYFDPISGTGSNPSLGPQWKMFRLNDGYPQSSRANDHPGEIYLTGNWNPQTNVRTRITASLWCSDPRCWRAECEPNNPWCTNENTASYWASSGWIDDAHRWVKWEVYAHRSDVDIQNGSFWLARDGEIIFDWYGDVCTHRDMTGYVSISGQTFNTPIDWRNLIWQNYWGNAENEHAEFWMDDFYLQFDAGQARVELGDASMYAACSVLEPQTPTAWADGSITIDANPGAFSPDADVWLYVTDADGDASNGYPAGIGAPTSGDVGGDGKDIGIP